LDALDQEHRHRRLVAPQLVEEHVLQVARLGGGCASRCGNRCGFGRGSLARSKGSLGHSTGSFFLLAAAWAIRNLASARVSGRTAVLQTPQIYARAYNCAIPNGSPKFPDPAAPVIPPRRARSSLGA